jgi:hypothetical protein
VGALSLYIEDESVPTVHVSLVREHTAVIRPPRALWVPFMLGRPLGVPNDASFQRRVVVAALRLLERPAGPVLEEYPEDAPQNVASEGAEVLACPVSFATVTGNVTLIDRVLAEIEQLHVWHDVAVKARGRTTMGLSRLPVEALAKFLGAWAEGGRATIDCNGSSVPDALRLACEDIKSFYLEAAAAQPGRHSTTQLLEWFWRDTQAAKLLFALQAALLRSKDATLRALAENNLIPRSAAR